MSEAYDAQDDFAKSLDVGYAAIRERMAEGGPGWTPKSPSRIEHLAEGVTLYLGDCREILPTLGKVDAVVTDPPYGIGFKYESHDDDPSLYEGFMREVVPLAESLVKDGGSLFWWQASSQVPNWHRWFPPNFRLMASCKDFVQMRPTEIQYAFDPIVFWYRGAAPAFQSAGSRQENAKKKRWDYHIAKTSAWINDPSTKGIHPCQRPIDAVKQVVLCASDRGETILDPFMGSGTTGVAAVKLGRRFIGIEIERKYFDIACRRISEALKQPDMFIERPKPAKQEILSFDHPPAGNAAAECI
jgi:DNA modification methylase